MNELSCDYDRTALGFCKDDSLSNCHFIKYYSNFVCIDPNYDQSGLNKDILAATGENGGMRSRCFNSDLHLTGTEQSRHPYRCYEVLCSKTTRTLTIRIGDRFALCLFPNQQITVPGYEGTLTCPLDFSAVCAVKRCSFECNANGVCINGRCLCQEGFSG